MHGQISPGVAICNMYYGLNETITEVTGSAAQVVQQSYRFTNFNRFNKRKK